jgi:hypothetical protein
MTDHQDRFNDAVAEALAKANERIQQLEQERDQARQQAEVAADPEGAFQRTHGQVVAEAVEAANKRRS